MYSALRATSRTLLNLLSKRFAAEPDLAAGFGAGGALQVTLSTPEEMSEANLQGLSVWLYRVVRDEEALNRPSERLSPTLFRPPPLPLRLHYLLTPLVTGATTANLETQQLILGKALQVLGSERTIGGADLEAEFSGVDVELQARLEPLGLGDIYQIWDALQMSYRLSVSYEVSVVTIDTEAETESMSPVLTIDAAYAPIVAGL